MVVLHRLLLGHELAGNILGSYEEKKFILYVLYPSSFKFGWVNYLKLHCSYFRSSFVRVDLEKKIMPNYCEVEPNFVMKLKIKHYTCKVTSSNTANCKCKAKNLQTYFDYMS